MNKNAKSKAGIVAPALFMKPSKLWSMLILIALAILLNGESTAVPSRRLSPSPRPTANSGTGEADGKQGQRAPVQASSQSPVSERLQSPTGTGTPKTGNSGQDSSYDAQQYRLSRFQTWFNFFLVLFTLGLFYVGRAQAKWTKLAYVANRPYLAADRFALKNLTTRERLPEDAGIVFMVANFTLRNVGKGPAIISSAKARLKILPATRHAGILPEPSDDWGDMTDCQALQLGARVVASEDSVEAASPFFGLPSEEDYRAIKMSYEKVVAIYGFVEYADVAGEPHRTDFGLIYRPPGLFGIDDFFTFGPARYNRNS